MRRWRPLLWIGVLVCFLVACSRSPVRFPEADFYQLQNGMKVFVLEDPSLPTFRLWLMHPAGAVFERREEKGIAKLTAELLRTGGTEQKSPEEVEEQISAASAELEFEANREEATIMLKVLAEDRTALLALLAELLQAPGFDPMAFERARRQEIVSLRRQQETPDDVASLYFPELIYGPESPWAAVPSEADLLDLRLDQAQRFYAKYYVPDRMILGVAGDFKTETILQELEATLGQWRPKNADPVTWPAFDSQTPQTVFISHEATQVALRLGHLGQKRTDPDKFAIQVANFILGGSGAMTSRLGSEIRSGQGQAYSVWSNYGFSRVPGIFVLVTETEASQQREVVQSIRRILRQIREEGVTATEVEAAQQAILRSLLFSYETRYQIVQGAVRHEFWGYRRNYLSYFAKQIDGVTVKAVNRVFKQDFHPDQLSLMVVGPEFLWNSLQQEYTEVLRRKK